MVVLSAYHPDTWHEEDRYYRIPKPTAEIVVAIVVSTLLMSLLMVEAVTAPKPLGEPILGVWLIATALLAWATRSDWRAAVAIVATQFLWPFVVLSIWYILRGFLGWSL